MEYYKQEIEQETRKNKQHDKLMYEQKFYYFRIGKTFLVSSSSVHSLNQFRNNFLLFFVCFAQNFMFFTFAFQLHWVVLANSVSQFHSLTDQHPNYYHTRTQWTTNTANGLSLAIYLFRIVSDEELRFTFFTQICAGKFVRFVSGLYNCVIILAWWREYV